jgi:preprotein translocase subunit SecG
MTILVTVIHVLTCALLIISVLIQAGRGGGLSGLAGGGQVIFGAGGAAPLIARITSALAIIFFLTSMSLAYLSSNTSSKALERRAKESAEPTPTTAPANPAPEGGAGAEGAAATAAPQAN